MEGSGAVVAGLQLAVLLTDGTVVVMLQVVLRETHRRKLRTFFMFYFTVKNHQNLNLAFKWFH